jgi:hypothetical protein
MSNGKECDEIPFFAEAASSTISSSERTKM